MANLSLDEDEIGQRLPIEGEGTITLKYKVIQIMSMDDEMMAPEDGKIHYTLEVVVESVSPELVDLQTAGKRALLATQPLRLRIEPSP